MIRFAVLTVRHVKHVTVTPWLLVTHVCRLCRNWNHNQQVNETRCLFVIIDNIDTDRLGTVIWSENHVTVYVTPHTFSHQSVYLYSATGLNRIDFRKIRNISCSLSPPACRLLGIYLAFQLPSIHTPLPIQNIDTDPISRDSMLTIHGPRQHLHLDLSRIYSMFPCRQNTSLWWEWNEAGCIPACEWLRLAALYAATLMEKYADGLTELTEIRIHIPHKFPWAPRKKNESCWEPSYVTDEFDSSWLVILNRKSLSGSDDHISRPLVVSKCNQVYVPP